MGVAPQPFSRRAKARRADRSSDELPKLADGCGSNDDCSGSSHCVFESAELALRLRTEL